jgi:hypothetical protein
MQERMPCGCILSTDMLTIKQLCSLHYNEQQRSKEPPKTLNAGVSEEVKTKDGMGR